MTNLKKQNKPAHTATNGTILAQGLYVHVPFCATTCNFCAFVQSRPNRQKIRSYLETIEKECLHYTQGNPIEFDTIFWGGGTPGLLLPDDLEQLGSVLKKYLLLDSVKEWTIEMAPATVTPAKLKVLKELGVNRISMGVQTFNDETLKIMDRYHSVSQVHRAWDWIQQMDFHSCSIDMIIAYPGQSDEELKSDLEQAIALNPDHISTYCLTFEEDTPLYAKLMKGIYKIDREQEADLYQSTWGFLESAGYQQYEISNFAKPGFESIHNCNTWKMQEWLALGPSASSQWRGERWTHSYDLEKWTQGVESRRPELEDYQRLDNQMLLTDSIIFGLRMNNGIHIDELNARFFQATTIIWDSLFQRLIDDGLAETVENYFRLTLEGRLLADAIAVEILEIAEQLT